MRFLVKESLAILLAVFFLSTADAQDDEENTDEVDSRSIRFHNPPVQRSCEYRRQHGVCKHRSECKRPTRHTCRFGLNPIVCCLDPPPTITTTTQAPPKTTKRPQGIKEIDLTFPDCGLRSPKVPKNLDEPSPRGGSNTNNGRRGSNRNSRRGGRAGIQPVIVGGVTARSNSWPWMVAVFKEAVTGGPKRFLCGASLISQRYVLTAAHCFDGERGNIVPSKFFVVVGSHQTKDGTEYPIENIKIHEEYKQRQYYNDIALLRVGKTVELTRKVYPVCLPSDGLRSKIRTDAKNVTVTGWGDTSFGGVSSKLLQELEIPIVPLKECNNSYSKVSLASFPKGITKLFICAGVPEGGKDACQGDSGGPLVSKLKDDSWVQLGVVSFGYGCAQAGFPGVYTRTSMYTKWLYDNTDLGK